MKTELLHKYFRGETTEKEENQIVEWVESSVENKEHFLKERMLFDVTHFLFRIIDQRAEFFLLRFAQGIAENLVHFALYRTRSIL